VSSRPWKFRVQDILDAMSRIQDYVENSTFEQFCPDRKTLDAVERNFIIIGEAAGHVPNPVREAFPFVPLRNISDMRNYVVHRYWGVEPKRVWETINDEFPLLIPLLTGILENAPE
jgi:uncharacterized protein with HEPN domain